jgi:hypothetical protein
MLNEKRHKKSIGVTRRRADALIEQLIQHATEINRNPELAFGVNRIVVFGSYLDTSKPKLGDLDVAVQLGPRARTLQEHRERCASRPVPASCRNFVEEVGWPEIEVRRILKNRSSAISLHEMWDFEALAKEHDAQGREVFRDDFFIRCF